MSVDLAELQTGIAEISISGIRRTYTDLDLPNEMYQRDLPVLIPDPMSPLEDSVNERMTVGTLNGGSGWKRTQTLNYVCLVAEVGMGRRPSDWLEIRSKVKTAVENAFCDFRMAGVHYVGPVIVKNFGLLDDALSAAVSQQQVRRFLGFTAHITVLTSY